MEQAHAPHATAVPLRPTSTCSRRRVRAHCPRVQSAYPVPQRSQAQRAPRRRCTTMAALTGPTDETAGPGTSAQPAEGTASLDATLDAFAALRRGAPYITAASLVADDVRFSLAGELVSLRGKRAYLANQNQWRTQVPQKLGRQWKWEVVRSAQTDSRTLVLRWRVTWRAQVPSWTLVGAALDEDDTAQSLPASKEEELPSVNVLALTRRLEAAERSLRGAQSALQSDAPAAAAVSAALDETLRQLREGLATSRALLQEVKQAEADHAGWFASDTGDEARMKASLASLRERLTCTVNGTSTYTLDASGRLVSHVEAPDFEDGTPGASPTQPAPPASWSDDEFPPMTAEERTAASADALFNYCLAHQPAEGFNGVSWRWSVTKCFLWENFSRDASVDDDVRMQLPRDEFDAMISGLAISAGFTASVCLLVFSYWALALAPQLPQQLQEAGVPSAANQAAAALPQALSDAAANFVSMMRGPSLFS